VEVKGICLSPYSDRGRPIRGRGSVAGPWRRTPSPPNCEPWQGHSQVRSARFQPTRQPRWVQRAESACSCPLSSRWTARWRPPIQATVPSPVCNASMSSWPARRRIRSPRNHEPTFCQSPFRETCCNEEPPIGTSQSADVGQPVERHVVVRRPAMLDFSGVKTIPQKVLECVVPPARVVVPARFVSLPPITRKREPLGPGVDRIERVGCSTLMYIPSGACACPMCAAIA
jgi:hypothetical protein